jgi:hypothetical protein
MTSNEQSTPLQIPRKKTSTIVIFRSVSIYELGSIWSNSEVSTQQMNQIKNTQHKGNPKVKNIYIQDKPISLSRSKKPITIRNKRDPSILDHAIAYKNDLCTVRKPNKRSPNKNKKVITFHEGETFSNYQLDLVSVLITGILDRDF